MKYSVKYEKSNLVLMTSMFIICLIMCGFWFVLDEYVYFAIYLILTILLSFIYYFTSYYIKDNYLLVRLGFIFIRIKYTNIKEITNLKASIKLKLNNMEFKIYPNNIDMFYSALKEKMGGK